MDTNGVTEIPTSNRHTKPDVRGTYRSSFLSDKARVSEIDGSVSKFIARDGVYAELGFVVRGLLMHETPEVVSFVRLLRSMHVLSLNIEYSCEPCHRPDNSSAHPLQRRQAESTHFPLRLHRPQP